MLRVLCGTTELEEYGEVIAIHDRVERIAAHSEGNYFCTGLDDIDWVFDRYADWAGPMIATVTGRVVAIDAVYVRLAPVEGGWTAAAGTARLESLFTTAETRRPPSRIDWGRPSPPDETGRRFRVGYPLVREGDEHLSGWVVALDREHVEIEDRESG